MFDHDYTFIDKFFSFFFDLICVLRPATYSWLKVAPRGLWLALHIGSHSMKMYFISCDVPLYLHFTVYRSFCYWVSEKFLPTAPKKETLQTWISSIAFDLSSTLETREERRDDRRRSRDRTCLAETRRVS